MPNDTSQNTVIEDDNINNSITPTNEETAKEVNITHAISNDLTTRKNKELKKDRRSITSKLNAQKAREARLRKKQEQEKRLEELFGNSDSETDSDSDSDSEDEIIIPKKYRKKTREQREIEELKEMIFKLAEKQKRSKRRKKRRKKATPPPQQPIINYNIQPPKQEEKPKEKKPQNPFMANLLKHKIIDED
jgi:hypothetical protein